MNKIICQIRRSKNYYFDRVYDLTFVMNSAQKKLFKLKRNIWDFSFRMKFIDYRSRLADIAHRTIDKINFDDIWCYYDEERFNNIDPGTLILPIDEDDWYVPHIVETLREVQDSYKIIIWDGKTNKQINEDKFFIDLYYGKNNRRVPSCLYGIVTPCKWINVKSHVSLDPTINKYGYYHLSQNLGFRLNHPGCLSTLIYWSNSNNVQTLREEIVKHALIDINVDYNIYPEYFRKEYKIYQELLQELLESSFFDYSYMIK